MTSELGLVAVGGGLGALVRYLVAMAAVRLWGEAFPWGTLLVNLMGSFAIGVVYAYGVEAGGIGPRWRLFLTTGLLGGMTTFSTFALETSTLLPHAGATTSTLNLFAHVIGGLLMVLLGMLVGRAL